MKNVGADVALLTPAADGWSLRSGTAPVQIFGDLTEAAAALPANLTVHLALPCHALIIEGLKLPATERAELAGMIALQLEKSLPYPIDEVSSDFVILESDEKETSVLSFAAPHAPLEALCRPLREAGRLPAKLTPHVVHVAAACSASDTVIAVYPEQGHLVLAICNRGQLFWAHVFASTDAARLTAELPQALLAATMEGAPSNATRLLLANEARALVPILRSTLPLPIEALPEPIPTIETPINLIPRSWRAAAVRQRRAQNLRGKLKLVGLLYALVALAAGAYLFVLQRQADALGKKFAAARPQLELIQAQQARSNALGPAVEPGRFTVEILYLVQRALPAPTVRITEFDHKIGQWRVTGEAPNAGLAIDYVTRLKADPELAAYQINAAPPQLLPNDQARFSIFGTR